MRTYADLLRSPPFALDGGCGESHAFDRRWQALRGHELGSAFRMAVAGALVQAHGGMAGSPTRAETSL